MGKTYPQSNYPRSGEGLVPRVFAPLLRAPLPKPLQRHGFSALDDLGPNTWAHYSDDECRELSAEVIRHLYLIGPAQMAVKLRDVVIETSTDAPIDGLGLDPRTRNALRREEVESLADLRGRTMAEILEFRSFGLRSLLDLLCALEALPVSKQQVDGLSLETRALVEVLTHMLSGHVLLNSDCRFGQFAACLAEQKTSKRRANLLRSFHEAATRAVSLTVEEELLEALESVGARHAQLVPVRLGIRNSGPLTLEATGQLFSLTRERVRQVQAAAAKALKGAWLPAQDRLVRAVTVVKPCGLEERVLRMLREAAPVEGRTSLASLEMAFELAGRAFPLTSVPLNNSTLWVSGPVTVQISDALRGLSDIAVRQSNAHGAASLQSVQEAIEDQFEVTLQESLLLEAVSSLPGYVDLGGGWFLAAESGSRNSLLNTAIKVFSLTQRIAVTELHEAYRRQYRRRDMAPPVSVVEALLVNQLGAEVSDGWATLREAPVKEEVLSPSELLFEEIFRTSGPVISGRELEDVCLGRGMNPNSFAQWLTYSPILTRVAPGYYSLRGAAIPVGTIEGLGKRERTTVFSDFGWTVEGHPWVAVGLSKSALISGTVTIPRSMAQHLEGAWDLLDESGAPSGRLVIKGTRLSGLSSLLKEKGPGLEDLVRFEWIPGDRCCKAAFGGPELLAPTSTRSTDEACSAT